MDFNTSNTLCNLRLIATLQKRQYLSTNARYDITGVYSESLYNFIASALTMETWRYTKKTLHKIYVIEVPLLIEKFFNSDMSDIKGVEKLCDLLRKSLKGLKNLKYSYEYNKEYDCYISTIIEDYCEVQIWKLSDYMNNDDYIDYLSTRRGGKEEIEKLNDLANDIDKYESDEDNDSESCIFSVINDDE